MSTTATVIPFPPSRVVLRSEPNEKLVNVLEDLARMARAGELTCFYGCGFRPDGFGVSVIRDPAERDVFKVLGGIDQLASRYRKMHDL